MTIDSSRNIIFNEGASSGKVSKLTPESAMTIIYEFSAGTNPGGMTIDSSGNYIVAEFEANQTS